METSYFTRDAGGRIFTHSPGVWLYTLFLWGERNEPFGSYTLGRWAFLGLVLAQWVFWGPKVWHHLYLSTTLGGKHGLLQL